MPRKVYPSPPRQPSGKPRRLGDASEQLVTGAEEAPPAQGTWQRKTAPTLAAVQRKVRQRK